MLCYNDLTKGREIWMKWYNSVKVKMIGFFLFVSIVFLMSIITVFYIMRESNLGESASKEAALMTSKILQEIKGKEIKAEEIVRSLASISGLFEKRLLDESEIISALFSDSKYEKLGIVSGGIWFKPGTVSSGKRKSFLFFNRTSQGNFALIKEYAQQADYTKMDFYRLGEVLQKSETAWTEVYTDPVTNVRMITVVSPVYKQNRFLGVATIDIAIDSTVRDIMGASKTHYKNRYLMMIDKKGNFIGKSELVDHFTTENNLFKVENESLKTILQYIKPSLDSGKRTANCYIGTEIEYIKPLYSDREEVSGKKKKEEHTQESICIVDDDPILNEASILAIYHFPRTHWNVIIGIPKIQVLAKNNALFYNVLLITILLTLFATVVGYFILQKLFVQPIESINRQLTNAISENTLLQCRDKGEIGTLVENLNTRAVHLAKAKERESKELQIRKAQEEMLMQQSKMAVMGEMMDSVAHQWKQPLNALMLYSELIRNDFEEGNVDQDYIEKFRKDIQLQIDHMVNTLDEFRSFFRPSKERQPFKLLEVVNSALFLAKDDILKNRILVKIEREDEIIIDGFENEFKHLILNIINNAKDAFVENDISQRLIRIRLISSDEGEKLEIEDNAGGIPEAVIDTLFDANVTTKPEGKGTGIGLYMSRQIANKHHATLTVENREEGACFIVMFAQEF